MKNATLVLVALAVILGSASLTLAGSILTIDDSSGNIGTVNVATGAVHVIGNSGASLTDIGYNAAGQLYGVSFTNLYTINTATAAASLIGATAVPGDNALVFGTNGLLYTAGSSNDVFILNPVTGASTDITPSGKGLTSSAGDLAFVGSTLYEAGSNNHFIAITLNASGTSVVGETDVGAFGFSNVFGLAKDQNGVLYGVSGTQIFSVNLATGQGTLVVDYGGHGLGNANGTSFFSEASAVPEPATLTMLGFGIAGLAGYGWRRRKQAETA